MRRFKFRLETNLKVVQIREDLMRQELQQRMSAYNQALEFLNQLKGQYRGLEQELREINSKKPQLGIIRLYRDYMGVMNRSIKLQQGRVEELKAELDHCRQRLKKLLLERKLLERLKSRKWSDYRKALLVEEQKQVDEMAINQFLGVRNN